MCFLAGNCYNVNVNINIMLYWLQVDHFCQSNRQYCALLVAVNKLFQSYNWFRNGKDKHTHTLHRIVRNYFYMSFNCLALSLCMFKPSGKLNPSQLKGKVPHTFERPSCSTD